MQVTVGTFNLNNLFSRYNFRLEGDVEGLREGNVEFARIRKAVHSMGERAIAYEGRALTRKDPEAREAIARRIGEMGLDILAVQEVEDIETLRYFARNELAGNPYKYMTLIEGNDPRLIDVAVLSKLPIGAVTTWQHMEHLSLPGQPVFSRDLLQVEILSRNRKKTLMHLFNGHKKSHFVPFTENQELGREMANKRRQLQAEMAAFIIAREMRPDGRFAALGDMNDPVDSPFLAPLVHSPQLQLVNGLATAVETRPAPASSSPPSSPLWTHRFKPSGQPAEYELFDHVWLSPALAAHQTGAFIGRRTKMGGDGSDHDPAWVVLEL